MKKLYIFIVLSIMHNAFGDTTVNNNSIHNTTIYMTQSPRITVPVEKQSHATIAQQQQEFSLVTKSILTLAGIAAVSYTALVATACYYAYRIRMQQGWGKWKEQVLLAVLQEIPEQELAVELHKALKALYGDLALSLLRAQFLHDSAQELHDYTFFLELRAWINASPLQAIMPAQAVTHQVAANAVLRLEFLQGIMQTDYFQEKNI